MASFLLRIIQARRGEKTHPPEGKCAKCCALGAIGRSAQPNRWAAQFRTALWGRILTAEGCLGWLGRRSGLWPGALPVSASSTRWSASQAGTAKTLLPASGKGIVIEAGTRTTSNGTAPPHAGSAPSVHSRPRGYDLLATNHRRFSGRSPVIPRRPPSAAPQSPFQIGRRFCRNAAIPSWASCARAFSVMTATARS